MEDTVGNNAHIISYLNYYLGIERPNFAVLLSGKWGCGKTYFAKKYIEEYAKTNTEAKIMYVSLYGMKSVAEIDDALFQQLHPVLSSKGMVAAGKIVRGLIKASLKIELDSNAELALDGSASELNIPSFMKNTDKCIIFFDDLERVAMNIAIVLGYINYFVEHAGLRVVIGNENEMAGYGDKNFENDEQDGSRAVYFKYKEKLIGKGFLVSPEISVAFDSYIDSLRREEVKKDLRLRKNLILDIFRRADYSNLRHLHRAFLEYERFYGFIGEDHRAIEELMDEIVYNLMMFSFEICASKVLPDDLADFDDGLIDMLGFGDNKISNSQISLIKDKYGKDRFIGQAIRGKLWSEFFKNGKIDSAVLDQQLKNSRYSSADQQPVWVRLWHFNDLDDDEFNKFVIDLKDSMSRFELKDPRVILHIAGISIRLNKIGMGEAIGIDRQNILSYIDQIALKGAFCDVEVRSETYVELRQKYAGYNGLGYLENDTEEFKDIVEYLSVKIEEKKLEKMPELASQLLDDISTDPNTFVGKISFSAKGDAIYRRIPILQKVSSAEFVRRVVELHNTKIYTIACSIASRYEMDDDVKYLLSEKEFITNVIREAEQKAIELGGTLKAHTLKNTLILYSKNALLQIEKNDSSNPQLPLPDA